VSKASIRVIQTLALPEKKKVFGLKMELSHLLVVQLLAEFLTPLCLVFPVYKTRQYYKLLQKSTVRIKEVNIMRTLSGTRGTAGLNSGHYYHYWVTV
jgi:hypothetical protein